MSQPDIEDTPDLNAGKPWSEMDLFDLANNVRLVNPIDEIAGFLCRVPAGAARQDRGAEASGRAGKTGAGDRCERTAGVSQSAQPLFVGAPAMANTPNS